MIEDIFRDLRQFTWVDDKLPMKLVCIFKDEFERIEKKHLGYNMKYPALDDKEYML